MSSGASSQETWTLKQCIDYGLTHNLQVRSSILSAQMSKNTFDQSKFGRLPTLNGFASHTYNIGQRIDPFTNQFANDVIQSNNFYLSTNVDLFGGLRTANTINQNKTNWKSSILDAEKMQNDIVLNIATVYLSVLFNEELLKIAEDQINVTQQQLGRMNKLVKAGAMAKGSLLEIEAQYATEELQIITASNNLDISRLSLKQLMELDSIEDFRIARPNLEIMDGERVKSTPGQIYNAALMRSPEVKSSELQLQSSVLGLNVAKGGVYPTLSFQASVGTGYSANSKNIESATFTGTQSTGLFTSIGDDVLQSQYDYTYSVTPFADQFKNNVNQTIGFNLSVPIFNGFTVRNSVSQAKVQIEIARTSLESLKNQIEKTIQQAYLDAVAALKKYRASGKSVSALQESFTYTEKRFEVGLVNAVDYNDAKNKLAKAKSDLLQAKYDYIFKTKILEFYQGKSISF